MQESKTTNRYRYVWERAKAPRCVCCGQSLGFHTAINYCDYCNLDLCLDDKGDSIHNAKD